MFLSLTRNSRRAARDALHVKHKTQKNQKRYFNFFKKRLAILGECAILFPVMRDMTDNQFRKIAETRMAQMKEWKAIPGSTRPTWEQFKRGLKLLDPDLSLIGRILSNPIPSRLTNLVILTAHPT